MAQPFVCFENVEKTYIAGEVETRALQGISFGVEKGELCVITGPSGAGKTTLLNILGGMDSLTDGRVFLDGEEISSMNTKQLTLYRRDSIGFVFQFYNLMPNLNAVENVKLASAVCKSPLPAEEVMELVGLKERMKNVPAQLSGGEQQRVAIARALAKNPKLLLCDEPTGALDYSTGKAILQLLQDMCRSRNMTVVLVTHNAAIAPMADRVIRIKNGEIVENTVNLHPVPVETIEW
ncbi:MAG: ABC transporter ATP-binding protein [Clostridia bacterium]|nr:ABC transporter ATP-binding protein [Clostridia bacterium]